MGNWRLFVGSKFSRIENQIVGSLPLTRYYPKGRIWLFDIARILGTRSVGIVFDAGANIGDIAGQVHRHLKCEHVYCFEPVSSTYTKLSARHGRSKNISCIRQALGSERGELSINLYGSSEVSTFLYRASESPRGTEVISVETIDDFCRDGGIHTIDILKMDVQGWELEVLKGAAGLLNTCNIRFIFTEVGFCGDPDMTDFALTHECLRDYGFKLSGFYDFFRWGDKGEKLAFANALYVVDTVKYKGS